MAPIRKRSEKISFRLEHKLSLKLEEVASVTKRNKSEVVRDAIEREVVRSLDAAETEGEPGVAITPTRSEGLELRS